MKISHNFAFAVFANQKNADIMHISFGGYSSVGRALAWHARGQRFDPAYLHQDKTRT